MAATLSRFGPEKTENAGKKRPLHAIEAAL
jgi:hypothetical protein